MCLMQYVAQGHCTSYWAAFETEAYSEDCQTFKMELFVKKNNTWVQAHNQKFFSSGEVSWNEGTSINISSKTQERKAPQGNVLEFFLLDTIKSTLWMKNLTQRWTHAVAFFFQNQGTFLDLKKRQGRPPPLSALVACLWVWSNMH